MNPLISLIAVFLGAMFAWVTSFYFETKRQKQRDLAVAYSLMFKVQILADEIWKLDLHLKEAIAQAERAGLNGPLWSKLPDIVGFQKEPERVTAAELALVAETRDITLVTKIRELESGHSILLQTFESIQGLRTQLPALKLGTSVEGRIVSYGGPAEDYPQYAHIFINLSDLSKELEEQVARIASNANFVAASLGNHLKEHYKFKKFLTLSVSPDYSGIPERSTQGS